MNTLTRLSKKSVAVHFLESMERFERHIGEALEETVRKYEAMDQIAAAEYAVLPWSVR